MSGGAITPLMPVSFLIAGRLCSVQSGAVRRGEGRGQNAGQADADIRSHAGQRSLARSWATSYSQDKSQLLQIQYPLLKIITAIRLPAHGLRE